MDGTAAEYRYFATVMVRGGSPLYERLGLGVADDREMLEALQGLPPDKRQPNLLLAAARLVGGTPDGYERLREIVFDRRDEVFAVMLTRRTQTNEAARCAGLYPALASLPQPLALLEVGASAGLLLLPDLYAYTYENREGATIRGGAPGSALTLRCRVDGRLPTVDFGAVTVQWRAGIDLNPLDVTDDEDARWLRMLVWPEQTDRLARLDAALEIARRDPPRIVAGDLNERLGELAAEAPAGATLVVLHTAVIDYLPGPERSAFVERVGELPGHWLSQEMVHVFPDIAAQVREPVPTATAAYVLALDGRPLAFTAMHGSWLRPL